MKRLGMIAFILALVLCFAMPAFAIKILPYSVPLQDIMRWDKSDNTLKLSNPEGESISVAWPATVDLWNYDGSIWKWDLPTGDLFAFGKAIGETLYFEVPSSSQISIGTYATALPVTVTGANLFGEMHNVILTDINVAYWYQAKYTKITTAGTTTNLSVAGHAVRMQIGSDLGAVYGIQCHTNITETVAVAQEIASISTMIDITAAKVATTDRVVALQAIVTGSGAAGTVTGLLHVVYFANRGTQVDTDAIAFIHNQSAATSDVAVEFDLDGTVTNAFEFNGTVCDGWTSGDATGADFDSQDEYALIPVTVDGVTPQLYIIAAETWN